MRIFWVITLLVVTSMFIVFYGHSQKNRDQKLISGLNNITSAEQLNYKSDQKAINEIISKKHPLNIAIVSSEKTLDYSYTYVVSIDGELLNIRIICYTYPFNFTLFENWKINQITRS
ncbi:hypothetical protein HZF08_32560 [Paenibacillus sp. CGMCC 1.16610]|uniref:DUF3139 domain-containing protein n=1 Tax=Paenibacillus anseongense TaxID=2682845 RepID=A0ABW9U237_9BACL|nr:MULTISPECIES: hypothetical protein [Paenibacillus]MBA2943000.1 hypothetical protein [Paenibacillus sp. CGMCC 1.16610]MVQ33496.1 hypothetical protein [Paenibacillus anseongense]